MELSIVVPAYNESENITEVIQRIEASVSTPHELIVVDDHSADETASLVLSLCGRFPRLKLVNNERERGFANALRSGFEKAACGMVVPVMADLCDELSAIDKMHSKMKEGFDIVCGSRYMPGGARLGGSKVKGFFSTFVGRSLHFLLGIPTHDIPNAFKLYRKEVLENVIIESKGFSISMEITLKAFYLGYRITEVPTIWKERTKGRSSFKMWKLFPSYLRLYAWGVAKRLAG